MPHFTTARDAVQQSQLADYTRKELESYMTDCHGFEPEELAEWETKDDLIADIKSFGWQNECIEFLS